MTKQRIESVRKYMKSKKIKDLLNSHLINLKFPMKLEDKMNIKIKNETCELEFKISPNEENDILYENRIIKGEKEIMKKEIIDELKEKINNLGGLMWEFENKTEVYKINEIKLLY